MTFVNSLNQQKSLRLLAILTTQIVTLPLYLLGYFFSKKENIWVFGNHLGDKDNSFYLFQYIREHSPEINAIWISKQDKHISKRLQHSYYYLSIKGIYYQYRAAVSVHTTGLGDFAKFTGAKKFRVQLWHGVPIKKIMLDSPETLPFSKHGGILSGLILRFAQRQIKETYDLTVASSEYVQEVLIKAFNQNRYQVVVTGYPRQDIISANCKEKNDIQSILYAPTWRSNNKQLLEIIEGGISAIKHNLTQEHYRITISLHTLNSSLYARLKNLENITLYEGKDINRDLGDFDLLITDYSSIALDFLPLKRDILFYTPDFEQYSVERGIYHEFQQLIKNRQIVEINNDSPIDIERYFKFNDQKACERITKAIINSRSTQL